MPGKIFTWKKHNFTYAIIAAYNRCISPLYIDKYTTADSFVLVAWHDIIIDIQRQYTMAVASNNNLCKIAVFY